jgi:hypothetical protein
VYYPFLCIYKYQTFDIGEIQMACENLVSFPKDAAKESGASEICSFIDPFNELRQEIQSFVGLSESLPIEPDRIISQKLNVVDAIENLGGLERATDLLGVSVSKPSEFSKSRDKYKGYRRGKYKCTTVFTQALQEFADVCGHPGVMPNRIEMVREKRFDLLREIYWRGGWENAIRNTGLFKQYKTQDYVDHPEQLKLDLLNFMVDHGKHHFLPDREFFESNGEIYLARAITTIGETKVAKMCGLQFGERKESGYWYDFENLEKELRLFIIEHGIQGRAPKLSDLERHGKKYLLRPIRYFGGIREVANKMGLEGAWKHFDRSAEDD